MSISNILTPNNFNLYCNNLNVSGTLDISGFPINSSNFTPTLTPINGISSITNLFSYYVQIGSIIQVFIKCQYTCNNSGAIFFRSNLPVSRSTSGNFSNISEVLGTGTSYDSGSVFWGNVACQAVNSSQLAEFVVPIDTNTTGTCICSISFIYHI